MEIRIPEEDYEKLINIAEKRELDNEDIKLLRLVLEKVGVVINLKEFVAIKGNDNITLMCPGLSIAIGIDIFEKSIVLHLNVENSINFMSLSIEVFPEMDEVKEFINKMKMRSGGYPLGER